MTLPAEIASFFWDTSPSDISLPQHQDFVTRRIIESGDLDAIKWLRHTIGDPAIRDWFLRKNGRGLDPRRLRFWELILDLPPDQVDEWVRRARESIWERRTDV